MSLYWNDRALGISPYDGEPGGSETLRAHGMERLSEDYTLRLQGTLSRWIWGAIR